ncbi:MAG: SpoIID/LytB domain-containing protein, partial [Syntrophomonadaceae bacterium]|nr:SpoIID/LytB domain-containing protein [Syntrophomonadaceae bacterium]
TAGCSPPAKKAEPKAVTLSPEVIKYKQEPTISLYRTSTGKTEYIKLEKYLEGVVAAEIGPKFPKQALEAQAIIARTMTLALLEYENGTRGKHNTDASDNHTEFQAYDEKLITPKISEAVKATRGEVLIYKGKFVYALFHSVSAGKTASIEEGFPKLAKKAPYLAPVQTGGIKVAPQKYRQWTVKVPRQEIISIMGDKSDISKIRVQKKGPSGRALVISAGQASIPAVDLRQPVGFDRLFSTQMKDIAVQGDYVVFKGSGWGHGVGMEQWGAMAMASQGKSSRQIITHYYPFAELKKLYQ